MCFYIQTYIQKVKGIVEEKIKRNPDQAQDTVPRTHELGGPGAPMFKIHKPLGKVTMSMVWITYIIDTGDFGTLWNTLDMF